MNQFDFLRLLLVLNAKQTLQVLKLITKTQLELVGEFCYNLLHGEIEQSLLAVIHRNRQLIRILGDKRITAKKRRKFLKYKPKQFLKVLSEAKHIIL